MPPKIESWTSEKEDILIFEVERRPMLWDASCEAYKRTDLKYNQWYQISEILGPAFNADMVQHRFTSMKQTFMTNLRRERESKKRCSGKSPEEIFKAKWVLYDKLKFLKKSCAQAESLSNLQTSLNTSYSEKKSLTDNIITHTIIEPSENNIENIEYLESDVIDAAQFHLHNTQQWNVPADAQENDTYNSSDEILSCSSRKNLSHSSLSPQDDSELSTSSALSITKPRAIACSASLKSTHNKENMYMKRGLGKKRKGSIVEEAFETIKALSNQPTSENDSAEYFGIFVAARLREMNPGNRKQCEHDIMKCLANY